MQQLIEHLRNGAEDTLLDATPAEKAELLRRLYQLSAAERLEDMAFPDHKALRLVRRNQYRLSVKAKWKGLIPAAIEIRLINETDWEIDFVRDNDGERQ